jgi:hypothetical protein
MLHFVQEIQYSRELQQITADPDEISQNVEAECSRLIASIYDTYGFVQCRCRDHALIVWYSTNGSTVSLLSIRPA